MEARATGYRKGLQRALKGYCKWVEAIPLAGVLLEERKCVADILVTRLALVVAQVADDSLGLKMSGQGKWWRSEELEVLARVK